MSEFKPSWEKFSGGVASSGKYQDWRFQVSTYLDGFSPSLLETWDAYILHKKGEGPEVSESLLNGNNARLAKARIVSTLVGEALQHVRSADVKHLCALLCKLDAEYSTSSASGRLTALQNLCGASQGSEESPESFVLRVQNIFRDELDGTIEPQEVLISAILSGANPKYRAVTVQAAARKGITVELVLRLLKEFEAATKHQKMENPSAALYGKASVLTAVRKVFGKQAERALKGKGKGGKPGGKPRESEAERRARKEHKCSECGKTGHYEKRCFEKHPELKPTGPGVKAKSVFVGAEKQTGDTDMTDADVAAELDAVEREFRDLDKQLHSEGMLSYSSLARKSPVRVARKNGIFCPSHFCESSVNFAARACLAAYSGSVGLVGGVNPACNSSTWVADS